MTKFHTTPDIDGVRSFVQQARQNGHSIGFVPTMGALHDGHVSLMKLAKKECDVVVASIFVNPTQFAPNEDLKKYPRPFEADLDACKDAGVGCVFHPNVETMYGKNSTTFVEVEKLTTVLEGAHRPSHFQGVTTIVAKLFNIVLPDKAFFGQKDYQQQLIIRRMCIDLDFPVEVVTCPTIRDPDGLAMSSRNRYLSEDERKTARLLSAQLQSVADQIQDGATDLSRLQDDMRKTLNTDAAVELDYASIVDPETLAELQTVQATQVALIAAKVGSTRLIDNMVIHSPGSGQTKPSNGQGTAP